MRHSGCEAFLSHRHRENLGRDGDFGHFGHAAGHADGEVVADLDGDDAAGRAHGNVAIHRAEAVNVVGRWRKASCRLR